MSNQLLKLIQLSRYHRFGVGFSVTFIAILIVFYSFAALWTFALKPVIGKSYPISAVDIETPVHIEQLNADPDYIFKTGERPILLFNITRTRTSTPIVTSRIACSNGFRQVINDRIEIPPTSRSFVNEPIAVNPIPKGAGGVCSFTFESEQRFKFLDQPRTQEVNYESVLFPVNNLGDKK